MAVKVDYLAIERRLELSSGRHRKTAFPSSGRKGVFIPAGMSTSEALQLLALADAVRPKTANAPSAPTGKARPRRSADLDLKMARLRLAALAAPLADDSTRN